MSTYLAKFRVGDVLTAKRLNELVDRLNAIRDLRLSGGLSGRMGPGGIELSVSIPTFAQPAHTTSGGISAFATTTLGSGDIVLETRNGNQVASGPTVKCYNRFAIPVTHPAGLMVAWDGSAWLLIGSDCPEE